MRKIQVSIAIAVFVALTLSVVTVAAESGTPITLQDAINKGLAQNNTLQGYDEESKIAASKVMQARSAYLPSVYAETSYMKQSTMFIPFPPMPGFNLPLTGTPYDTYTAKIGVKQLIYGKERVSGVLDSAALSEEASRLDYLRAKHDITLVVIKGYFDLLKAIKGVEISEELLDQAKEHLRLAEKLVESGTGTKLSVTAAKLQVANTEANLIKAQNYRDIAQGNFNYILNENIDTYYIPDERGIDDILTLQAGSASLPELRAIAYKNREEYNILRKKTDALKAIQVGYQSENSLLPTVNLVGEYSINSVNNTNLDKNNWVAAIAAHWSIFDGMRSEGQAAEADGQIRKLTLMQKDINNKISLEVEQAYRTIRSEEKRLKSVTLAQELAEEKYHLEEKRYKVGLSDDTRLIDSQTLLFQAKIQAVEARYDYLYAVALCKRSIGEL